MTPDLPSRRDFFGSFGSGLGGIALAAMLAEEKLAAAPRLTGPVPKARRIIQLFMNGGASQCDLFDYKPRLIELHGRPFDPGNGERVEASVSVPGAVMKSPFAWAQHGQSGRWVSNALPHLAQCVDRLAFLMAMTSSSNVHGPAAYLQTTGFSLPGFPCLGAWISYALGNVAQDVPAFVALPDSRGFPYNGRSAFSSGFLPSNHQGVVVHASSPHPITHLAPPPSATHVTQQSRLDGLPLLARMNAAHAAARSGDARLQARIDTYKMAARLQLAAPGLLDLSGETEATRRVYGLDRPECADFARNCLLARRMIERGVRFVQVWNGHGGGSGNWDNHGDIPNELGFIARTMDQPAAALLRDLDARGLLDDTLLIWTTEFGRMPFSQGNSGRDHNGGTFVSWFAGAGIRPGTAHGESDEWSWKARSGIVTCHDFHATILHLLGIDHETLTVYHNGIDRRLTDVHGRVVHEILS
ncbi:MAG TPA: DUF1501 domain-containing protein [Verrucomicrobiales bacterium]|nr:DUF1501 domain-containing protein [Verrucomicrobiales bacterium]